MDLYTGAEHTFPESGFRHCPGEYNPNSGINCITLWMNGTQGTSSYVMIRNIRVVGPDPVPHPNLSISNSGAVTFDAGSWLEVADSPEGPWVTVSIQSPHQVPPGTGVKFYRAVN